MPSFNFRELASQIIRGWRRRLNRKNWFSLHSLILLKGLIVSLLSLWAFLEISDNVLANQTRAIDRSILLAVREMRNPLLDFVMKGFSFVGGTILVTIICVGLGIKLWVRRQKIEFLALSITAIGGTGLNLLIKQFFERDRPQMWALTNDDLNTSSYPSGHAMLSLIVYGFWGYLLASRHKRWRWLILGVTIFAIVMIGCSRLYVGLHWPTDVIAGYAAGFSWLSACILSLEIRQHRRDKRRQK